MSQQRKMRIHFLVEDSAGPIESREARGQIPIGRNSTWRAACDPAVTLGTLDRGTDCPWAVRCDACKATEAFKKADRPKPLPVGQMGDLVADGS